jgi:hypothetical protein
MLLLLMNKAAGVGDERVRFDYPTLRKEREGPGFLATRLCTWPRVRLSEKKQSICGRTDDPVAIAGKRKRQTFDGAPPRLN